MTSLLQRAIDDYHELLTDELAQQSQAALDAELQRRGLSFGGRPLCTVLRPRFLTPSHYRFLRQRGALLLRAFERLYRAAVENAPLRRQFGLLDWEESLMQDDPGFPDPSPTSRIDAFYLPDHDVLHLTEYNAETPAGAAYGDALADVFQALPVIGPFLRRYDARPLPTRPAVLHALLAAYTDWAGRNGTHATPRVAILDWREVPTYNEFVLWVDYFGARGIEAVIVDPRETELSGGRLVAGGKPIDLIYKRVLINELVQREGLDHPVIRAVRSGAVCMVNPFRCKLLHKKASLAVLSDERNVGLFADDERQAIAAHIPWTRVIEERTTRFRDKTVDLVPFIIKERAQLVLKPNDEYGGKGIVLGWEVDDAAWEQAVRTALAEPFVVQQRVPIPSEPFPSLDKGRLVLANRVLDTNPYAYYGSHVDGVLSRLSTAALVNVTAGGGSQTPTFLVEER
jgi:uncharacterized circularly permuted ATP-grasp superfamily protein